MPKALLYLACFIVVQIVSAFGVNVVTHFFFPEHIDDTTTSILITTTISSVVLVLLFLLTGWCNISRKYLRSHPWGMLAWCALLAVGMVLPLTWLEEQLPDSWQVNIISTEMAGILKSTEGYFVVCMLAPLMEEVLFRGAMIPALLKWWENRTTPMKARWAAIGVSALLFSLAHMNPAQIPHALIVGVLLGWLYTKTHSIAPGLLIHWINNSAAYVAAKMFPLIPIDAKLEVYFDGNDMAEVQAIISSMLIALPALYQMIVTQNNPEYNRSITHHTTHR
jgi:membrane protease YdiL (CAAX protease family)